jgi:hypothetical protein
MQYIQFQESFRLIRMQLPEKYKENFDVSSEGLPLLTFRQGTSLETSKFSLYFSLYFSDKLQIPTYTGTDSSRL